MRTICVEPGCRKLVVSGRCERHKLAAAKGSDNFYQGRPWRRLRQEKLSADPRCEVQMHCDGEPATDAHHIKKRLAYPELAYDIENLQSACKACHDYLTSQGK